MVDEIRPSRVRPGLDPPSKADHARLRRAREIARSGLVHSDPTDAVRWYTSFREELGAVVRSASPLVVSTLDLHGLTLDDAVDRIKPVTGWPIRPRLSERNVGVLHSSLPLRRFRQKSTRHLTTSPYHGMTIVESGGGHARLQLIDHSLELDGSAGPIRFQTRFGQLRVELTDELPNALLTACIGRRIGEIADNPAWRGRDWTIAAVEATDCPWIGQRLFSAIGTIDYRVSWAH